LENRILLPPEPGWFYDAVFLFYHTAVPTGLCGVYVFLYHTAVPTELENKTGSGGMAL
jgi:hypothetical protein